MWPLVIKIERFDILNAFLRHYIYWVIHFKNGAVFWPTLYNIAHDSLQLIITIITTQWTIKNVTFYFWL